MINAVERTDYVPEGKIIMERLMTHNIKKDLIYYGVYSTSDDMWNGSDVLCAARKRFFETGTKQKKRSTIKTDNVTYNYSYALENGTLLKYRKTKAGLLVEHVVETPDGYYVEQLDDRRQPIKRTYYLRQHLWQRTEYLSEGAVMLRMAPGDNADVPTIVCKSSTRTTILYPFDVSLDKELTQKLNILTSEPKVFCVTNCGSFYFCTEDEQLARKQALDKLLQEEKTADEETVSSASARAGDAGFVINADLLQQQERGSLDLFHIQATRLSDLPEAIPDSVPEVSLDNTPEAASKDTPLVDDGTSDEVTAAVPPAAVAAPDTTSTPDTLTEEPPLTVTPSDTATSEAAVPQDEDFFDKVSAIAEQALQEEQKAAASTDTPAEVPPTVSAPSDTATSEAAAAQDEDFFDKVAAIAERALQEEQKVAATAPTETPAEVPPTVSTPSDTAISEATVPQDEDFFDKVAAIAEKALQEEKAAAVPAPAPTHTPAEEPQPAVIHSDTTTSEAADPTAPRLFDEPNRAAVPMKPNCSFAEECPYEAADKCVITSDGKRYYYFGEMKNHQRDGRGRTVMPNGETAYEGEYVQDRRDGFGVYYYQSGQLCYVGDWKQNRREGFGAAFSAANGSVLAGRWQEDHAAGVIAHFDKEGHLLYAGGTDNGQRSGAGLTYNRQDGTYFIGKYQAGVFLETGTQFDSNGDLLYTGGYRNNARNGEGTAYTADGRIRYRGQWLNDCYHGEGTLYREDGSTITGHFKNGQACGHCTLTDTTGRTVYSGSFLDDRYNGVGRLFLEDGRYAEGRFIDGEPTGIFNEYSADKRLIYCGEWDGKQRSGRGIAYENGEKRYEGEFRQALYHGQGKLYRNGEAVYIGTFKEGRRDGFGVSYEHKEMCYKGLWHNDCYNGSGILYENGEARFVGLFRNGQRDGRINEIENRHVRRRSLYANDERVYTCEYSRDGSLVYYGSMSGDQRSGMGCSFGDHAEKQFEGIFRHDKPDKAMRVFLKELPELPVCTALASTEYELYRLTPEYIIEKSITVHGVNAVYSGRLKNGLPDGSGTILYSDHRYTGYFSDGLPQGEGILYLHSGEEHKGLFSTKAFEGCQTLVLSDLTYFYRAIT